MTTTFGTDLVDKTNQAKVNACKARLELAVKAASDLDGHVRWLVKERAWLTLGYAHLAEMWEAHSGLKCPTHVQAIAVDEFRREGMNTTRGGKQGYNGHTRVEVARAVGQPVHLGAANGPIAGVTGGMITQLEHGVPPEHVTTHKGAHMRDVIEKHGATPRQYVRKRAQPVRMGKLPDELVSTGISVPKCDDDLIADIAREAGAPKAHIYRQAVAEYLMRYRESRPDVAS